MNLVLLGHGKTGALVADMARERGHEVRVLTSGENANAQALYAGAANDPARPMFVNYGQGTSPRADFIGAAYDRHGQLWGGLVEQLGPRDSSGEVATTGYLARLLGP